MKNIFLLIAITIAAVPAFAQDIPIADNPDLGLVKFENTHSEDYVWDAIDALGGQRPAAGANRTELAEATLGLFDAMLPRYGQKGTAQLRSAVPEWFTAGYQQFNPSMVSHSRYFDALLDGQYQPDATYSGLYSAYCAYDAEWFTLSRHANYKAWLSAVLLDFAADWQPLRIAGEDNLHRDYVVPLQTKDEPYREIDNWIKRVCASDRAFLKPTVRNALVQELLSGAGFEVDTRYVMDEGYSETPAARLGVSDTEFYLLAALSLEFFEELAVLAPDNPQKNHFRDYFVEQFYALK